MGSNDETLLPRKLSARYLNDFAYPSIRERLPVILTKIVDVLFRSKCYISDQYGENSVEELKDFIGKISQLRSELQTDKPFTLIDDNWPDVETWNDRIQVPNSFENPIDCVDSSMLSSPSVTSTTTTASWFTSSWLLAECYCYRRVASISLSLNLLKGLDPFKDQKQSAMVDSKDAIISLSSFLLDSINYAIEDETLSESLFKSLFYACLWGNKCDLSISSGESNNQLINVLEQLQPLKNYILQDDVDRIYNYMMYLKSNNYIVKGDPNNNYLPTTDMKRIDIVLDNAGFELFTDLCLAEYFSGVYGVEKVYFHTKMIPWFISDTTKDDCRWSFDWMKQSDCPDLQNLANIWEGRVQCEQWIFTSHHFWTLPDTFDLMNSIASDLHEDLTQSSLIIFKGDLNYRKLTGDRKWPFNVCFGKSLRGFHPSSLCALRTLKSDTVVGLSDDAVNRAKEECDDWMISGQFGVIQSILPLP